MREEVSSQAKCGFFFFNRYIQDPKGKKVTKVCVHNMYKLPSLLSAGTLDAPQCRRFNCELVPGTAYPSALLSSQSSGKLESDLSVKRIHVSCHS